MKKTFAEWEIDQGIFAYEPSKFGSKTLTLEEFQVIIDKNPGGFHGVNYKDRTKFLKDNGYELTRENLFADLSAKPKPEE